ncbi:MAG: redoxin domain-containing protein [Planctomycetes bacterium]|nr:redoxin domain-containing protein [Planctomycetota bacterium]
MKKKTLVLCLAVALAAPACKFIAAQIVDYTESWSSGMPKSKGSLAGGLQNGDWVFYYENGKPRAKGQYTNDRQIGPWTYYYENGVVERTGAFDDKGVRTGEWTLQYQDQTPQARGSYIADFEDGPWQFFAKDGSLERAGAYDAGKLSGPWSYYWPGGKLKAEGMCFQGQRIGPWRVVDERGQERVQDFGGKPGVQIVRETWPNGTTRRTGVRWNGAPAGRWTSYHDTGAVRFACTLNGAVASGVFEARDAAGNVTAQGVLTNGAFAPGSVAVQNGQTRPLTGPLPAAGGEPWAAAEALAAMAPEAAVALFVAEAGSAVAETAVVAKITETTTPPPPPTAETAAVVQGIDDGPTRAAAPMQPDLSVKQRQEMKDYVAEYTDGPKPGGGSLLDKYRVSTPGAPARTIKDGELQEWYGKPMPFQTMKGVDGKDVDLGQYRGKKQVMVVVLRGFLGEVCAYCVAQTKALSQQREKLEQLGVEVLVIYPGAKENEASFEQAYKMTFNEGGPPYRVFYDPNLELVKQLGIDGDLAKPSTIIVDKEGMIRFFYKGEHKADRPAAKKLLEIIEGMQK